MFKTRKVFVVKIHASMFARLSDGPKTAFKKKRRKRRWWW
jgi:hypothetical protein